MMELKLSREPLQKNPSCAYCGNVFNKKGINLELILENKVIDFPICPACFEMVTTFEASLDLDQGYARIKR